MFNSQQWLLIGLAGAWGYDKLDFTERLEKAQELRQLDPAGAESPAYAMAMLDGLDGNSRVRVHLDASASGIQCLAALANCEKSGTACNLFGSKCNDAYSIGINQMTGLDHIPRKLKKEAMMTALYGSQAVPRDNLGKENLPAFYKMLQEEFTGAWNVFLTIQDQWRSDVTSHRWTMPDGFEVIQWNTIMKEETVELWGAKTIIRKKTKATQRKGLSLAANVTHAQWA